MYFLRTDGKIKNGARKILIALVIGASFVGARGLVKQFWANSSDQQLEAAILKSLQPAFEQMPMKVDEYTMWVGADVNAAKKTLTYRYTLDTGGEWFVLTEEDKNSLKQPIVQVMCSQPIVQKAKFTLIYHYTDLKDNFMGDFTMNRHDCQ
ncbi:hypothetical protein PsW64_04582 [Pseudovibrio sp. W64]|uniref:hypothetical protein n=1 Tax=unclassified Pseudovibrio TaxID=2627060 RepID=UPI0007AE93D3|nr:MULTISPECIES: hypothetical protein [unclassified Pseudovibrio]KZK77404.1 hypothetical protein PsW64_04582 [Pseudovibrio sp. W64]KZK96203.1 hypothetical protein PsAD46_00052 [Pseudovibrio sp. Ad46]